MSGKITSPVISIDFCNNERLRHTHTHKTIELEEGLFENKQTLKKGGNAKGNEQKITTKGSSITQQANKECLVFVQFVLSFCVHHEVGVWYGVIVIVMAGENESEGEGDVDVKGRIKIGYPRIYKLRTFSQKKISFSVVHPVGDTDNTFSTPHLQFLYESNDS